MSYEKKDGDFVLFKAKIRKTEKWPHYRGTILKDGVKHEFSMWEKTSKNGLPYFSGSMGGIAKNQQSDGNSPTQQQSSPIVDDEIPW